MQGLLTSERATELRSVARRLRRTGLPFCLIGGAAERLYGVARAPRGVDFLVAGLTRMTLAWVFPRAQPTGSNGLSLPDVTVYCSPLALAGATRKHPFDLDDAMCGRRRISAGGAVPVLSPEDQVVMTAILQRGSETLNDLTGLRELLDHQGHRLDFAYIDWRAARAEAQDEVRDALVAVGWNG